MPILHRGSLAGRLDPKFHRARSKLEIRMIDLEPGFDGGKRFRSGLAEAVGDPGAFPGAERISVPRPWRTEIG